MKIDLLPILNADGRKLPLDIELDFVGKTEQDARFLTPIKVVGQFANIGGSIELSATASCRLELFCDRCCDAFESDFECSFEEVFKKEDARVENDKNPDAVILSGTAVDICEVVTNNIVLNLPFKRLCSEGCKGLCANCGQNLNEGDCGCDTRPTDPRFDILDGLL